MAAATVPDAAQAYALGRDNAESDRLRRQSDELRPEAAALLDRVGLAPGQAAIDLGCGPSGILDLLCAAVSPAGGSWALTPTRGTSRWRRGTSAGWGWPTSS